MWIDHKAIFLVKLLLSTLLEKDIGDGSRGCSKDLPYRLNVSRGVCFLDVISRSPSAFLRFLVCTSGF